MQRFFTILAASAVGSLNSLVQADLTGFDDFDEWDASVNDFSTIDFTEHPAGTPITDQYADRGVQFPDGNDHIFHTSSFVNDGAGLTTFSDLHITVEFDTPQLWFGVDHPGIAMLDVYAAGDLVGTYENIGGGVGFFTGVVSKSMFDKVVIHRGSANSAAHIDDMHWGVPGPGAVAGLVLAGLLGGSRRRRL